MGLVVSETSLPVIKTIKGGLVPNEVNPRYHKISGIGIFHAAKVSYSSTSKFPEEPAEPEIWQVGYIVNILWEDLKASYGPRRTRHEYIFSGPILDTLGSGSAAWYSNKPIIRVFDLNIQVFKEFTYGGGKSTSPLGRSNRSMVAHLQLVDFPTRIYLNEYKGNYRGDQLREIEDTIMFGIWIAARRKVDPKDKVDSYKILWGAHVLLPIRINITGDFWPGPFSKQTKKAIVTYSAIPKPGRGSSHGLSVGGISVKPVISRPIANDFLVKILVNSGIIYSGPHMR